jgi:MFS family permease
VPEIITTTNPRTRSSRQLLVASGAALVAFLAYSAVYAYRKPFTTATFTGVSFWGVSYQTWLIISQVIGYMLSKFAGIRFIAELKRNGRWKTSVMLVGIAWISLFFFAITPAPYGMIWLLINGFMLGFMWGIIFSYVEGRRATDFIGTVMAISFIFAGGFTRSVAGWLMTEWGVTEKWMPFVTGLVFIGPYLLFIFLLERLPPPDKEDVKERTQRQPMNATERRAFIKKFGVGIVMVSITYLFLTIIRDIRDNYMVNIWSELGYKDDYSLFARSETQISLILLGTMALLALIRKNMEAFRVIHVVIAIGFILAGISSWLFIQGLINGRLWMQLVGLGLYMSYIPFNCIFFERMIAAFRIQGNVGFLIYIADAFGYLGSVTIMLTKEFMDIDPGWAGFYSHAVVIGSLISLAGIMASWGYFNKKYYTQNSR